MSFLDIMSLKHEIAQRERLVQTYIVLYGLLISCGQNVTATGINSNVVNCFFVFFIAILVYYVSLSKIMYETIIENAILFLVILFIMELCAVLASIYFSLGVVSYMTLVVSGGTIFYASLVLIFLIFVVWISLSLVLSQSILKATTLFLRSFFRSN